MLTLKSYINVIHPTFDLEYKEFIIQYMPIIRLYRTRYKYLSYEIWACPHPWAWNVPWTPRRKEKKNIRFIELVRKYWDANHHWKDATHVINFLMLGNYLKKGKEWIWVKMVIMELLKCKIKTFIPNGIKINKRKL